MGRILVLLAAALAAQPDPFALVPEPAPARTAVVDSADFAEVDVEPEEDGLRRRIARLAGPGDFPKRLPRYARRIMRDFFRKGERDQFEYGISVSSAVFRDDGALRYAYRVFYKNIADPRHSVNIPARRHSEDLFNFHTHPPEDAGVPSYCPDQDQPVWGGTSRASPTAGCGRSTTRAPASAWARTSAGRNGCRKGPAPWTSPATTPSSSSSP